MASNVLTALNMILQAREQRERSDIAASLSGMELALKEKEMASYALDRKERRELAKLQFEEDKKRRQLMDDQFTFDKRKYEETNFKQELEKVEKINLNALHRGAETMFDTMFSSLYQKSTAGGEQVKKTNYNSLYNKLVGDEYQFTDAEASKITNAIMSYGIGGAKANPYAMAELAKWMKNRATVGPDAQKKNFINSLVRGGMVANPQTSEQSFKDWLTLMEGLHRTSSNQLVIEQDWIDFTDNDPSNDYTMRPLQSTLEYKVGQDLNTGGTGGGGTGTGTSSSISMKLSELQAMNESIKDYEDKRDSIINNTSLSKKEINEKLKDLNFQAYGTDKKGKRIKVEGKSVYENLMSGYNITPEGLTGGYDKSISGSQDYGGFSSTEQVTLNPDAFALLDPEDAVDYIADHRDKMMKEQKDAQGAIKQWESVISKVENRAKDRDIGEAVQIKLEEAKINRFRETERLKKINESLDKFWQVADVETEKYIDDSWWGAGNEARSFRSDLGTVLNSPNSFPYDLLTKSEQQRIDERRDAMKSLGNFKRYR